MSVKPDFEAPSTLDQVAVGATAIVIQVLESSEVREHLAARGIGPGVPVRVLKSGDPLLVAVDQSRWAIGRHHARSVEVVPGGDEP
jgi:Fe2+ transport system protein FeoA